MIGSHMDGAAFSPKTRLDSNKLFQHLNTDVDFLTDEWFETVNSDVPSFGDLPYTEQVKYEVFKAGKCIRSITIYSTGLKVVINYSYKDGLYSYFDSEWDDMSIYSSDNNLIYYASYYGTKEPAEKLFYYKNGQLAFSLSYREGKPRICYQFRAFNTNGSLVQRLDLDNNNELSSSSCINPYNVISYEGVDDVNSENIIRREIEMKKIDVYNIDSFVQEFLNDCKNNNIIIPDQNIIAVFEELPKNTIALSFDYNKNESIKILVDPVEWKKASIQKKMYIIYHELGHDVFNLDHGQGGKMMFNFADREYSWYEFFVDKNTMFDYVKSRSIKTPTDRTGFIYDSKYGVTHKVVLINWSKEKVIQENDLWRKKFTEGNAWVDYNYYIYK
jgi:hypothetical protein